MNPCPEVIRERSRSLDAMADLFVFDLDGTLLTSDHRILDSSLEAIEELAERGHLIVVASARPSRSIHRIIDQYELEPVFVIALNGALVFENGQLIRGVQLPEEVMEKLTREAKKRDLAVNLYTEWEWYTDSYSEFAELEAGIVGIKPTRLERLSELSDTVYKLLAMGEGDRVGDFQESVRDLGYGVEATRSKPIFCDVVKEGVSKARALVEILRRKGLEPDRVVAFGDGENDIGLLREADLGVAMGNSRGLVRRGADFVTRSHDEDGIVHALRKHDFIE